MIVHPLWRSLDFAGWKVLLLTEIGKHLKEARMAKGLSLDDLQGITKIQKRYLRGIEEGDYSLMPGNFYVRAFIKHYAEAVGLDPEVLFEEFKDEIPSAVNDDLPGQLSRVQSRKALSDTGSKVLDILPKLLIGVVIVGAFVFAWYFLAQKGSEDTADEQAPKENSEVTYEESEELVKEEVEETEKETKTAKNNNVEDEKDSADEKKDAKDKDKNEKTDMKQEITVTGTQGYHTYYELANAEKFEVKLVTTGDSWVNIKNGQGNSFFQGMMKEGGTEIHDLSQESDIVIVVGNTMATEIYVNEQKLEYAIAPEEHVRQNIAIHYVKSETEPEQ